VLAHRTGVRRKPLSVWFFIMYGSIMVYQGLWAGPFFHDILGWDKDTYGLVLSKKVLIIGTGVYTIIWAIIWITPGQITRTEAYMAIDFLFGFFGGFFAVSFAQIKKLFTIVGTSTAALNIFPFASGAILQQVSGLMLTTRSPWSLTRAYGCSC
jgi:hypothetical protein